MANVAWFSGGVSSAVAIKLAINEIDEIYYIHIDDQHGDTIRFIKDCEKWFRKKVVIMQSKYHNVNDTLLASQYVNGVHGAPCTKILKKRVRKTWERNNRDRDITYYWGMDSTEGKRADRIIDGMHKFNHVFPLIDKRIGKKEAHEILNASGIKRPKMYDLGYYNNNCIGCVKGGQGYWNKIREDFPEVFKLRSEMERIIGASCIKGIFLDELKEDQGRKQKPIVDDCGIFCQIQAIE